jgi:hypothetical protein
VAGGFMNKQEINIKLKEVYGTTLDGHPKFRVVWSDEEVEKRQGEFEVWYGPLFVRKESGIKEFKKYSYISEKWILEFYTKSNNPELLTSFSYEPLYTFQGPNEEYLPLNWDVCSIVINSVLNRKERAPMTNREEENAEREEKEQRVKRLSNRLKDIMPTEEVRKARLGEVVYNAFDGGKK